MTKDQFPLNIAHRGGVGSDTTAHNTFEAVRGAILQKADAVEVDVHQTKDGYFVTHHNRHVNYENEYHAIKDITRDKFESMIGFNRRYEHILDLCVPSLSIHLDIKLTAEETTLHGNNAALECVLMAIRKLGKERVIISSRHDEVVSVVRAGTRKYNTLVGLTLGGGWNLEDSQTKLFKKTKNDLFPTERIEKCGANLLVVHYLYAKVGLYAYAERHNLPIVIWTVNTGEGLERWSSKKNVLGICTDEPTKFHYYKTHQQSILIDG